MVKVAVVILNHNGKKYLEQFLPLVVQYSKESQVVVADNGSTDGSQAFLQNNFPEVLIIYIQQNEGFSKGYNVALKQIAAQYYVLLNSDVEVTPQWLSPLIRLMDANPAVAACQPKIKSYHQKQFFEYAGAAGGYIDKYGYPFCRGRIFDHLEEDKGQYNDSQKIFWASGACMMIRSRLYWEAGGLDDFFFAHMEEIDLCWRLKNRGYQIYFCGESEVYHVGGGTLHKSNPRKTFLNFRNGLILLYKNLPPSKLWKTLFIRMLLDGVAAIKFLFSTSANDFIAVIQAHMHFYRYIFNYKNSKKQNINNPDNGLNHAEIYPKSIVYAFYVEKKKIFNELKFRIPR